jgi:large subunit ribosomal protein L28
MSRVCQLTGKKVIVGNSVSHSNIKTKRTFKPNLHLKRFWVPELNDYVFLKVSAKAIRTIDKNGILNVMAKAFEKGYLK